MPVEAKRLYVIGGSEELQEAEKASFRRRKLEVVQFDLPSEPPLANLEVAMARKANVAVVNMGRYEKATSGLIGEHVIRNLRLASQRMTIVTCSSDTRYRIMREVYDHVLFTTPEESAEEVAQIILEAPEREIVIIPKKKYL
jgi:hypothetical protein